MLGDFTCVVSIRQLVPLYGSECARQEVLMSLTTKTTVVLVVC